MVVYSRRDYVKNHPELTSETSQQQAVQREEDSDEIVEFTSEAEGMTGHKVETQKSVEFINIANCSNETIMIPDLFGPGQSLILGTIERPSEKTAPPVLQVDGSFRGRLNKQQNYQNLLSKGILREVNEKAMSRFLNVFYKKIGVMHEVKQKVEEGSLDDMNLFVRGEDDSKVRESIEINDSTTYGKENQSIDILPSRGNSPGRVISTQEHEEMNVLQDLGISEDESSGRLKE